jgi:branched-chain amino acid transport system substrate-binding protein
MTRLLSTRKWMPVPAKAMASGAALLLALVGCQQIGPGGGLQAQRAPATAGTQATPPSHQRPPLLGPQTSQAPVPPGSAVAGAAGVSSGAQVFQAQPPGTFPAGQPAGQPAPGAAVLSPDLPSLAALLNRAPSAEPQPMRPLVPPPATTDTVRVGLLLPLSGRNAAIGKALLNAAQLAMFDFADRRLELLPIDTRGTPTGAQAAAQTAIGDGAQVILGPLLAGSVQAAAPAARAAHVPVIAFSSDRRVGGGGV